MDRVVCPECCGVEAQERDSAWSELAHLLADILMKPRGCHHCAGEGCIPEHDYWGDAPVECTKPSHMINGEHR